MTAASQPHKHGSAVSWFVVKSSARESSQENKDFRDSVTDGTALAQPRLAMTSSGESIVAATAATTGTWLLRFDANGRLGSQTLLQDGSGSYQYLAAVVLDSDGRIWIA